MQTLIRMKRQLVGIVGSRGSAAPGITNYLNTLDKINTVIVSGGCGSGADWIAKEYCKYNKVKYLEAVAFWNRAVGPTGLYDKSAGFFRNKTIVEVCDKVVAFWNGKSPGTKSLIDYAHTVGTPIEVISV